MKQLLHFDYTAVGHVTVDVLDDGSRRPGGTAFYSALQASRLGQRALILTRGVPREIEELLEPYSSELELQVLAAPHTTTLRTIGRGASRTQRVLAWAGPIADELELDTAVLHLAPVARETPSRWRAAGAFVGLTPQGMMREWPAPDGEIWLRAPTRADERLAARCDAIVLSEHEYACCGALVERTVDDGAVALVTAGAHPSTVLLADGRRLLVEVPEVAAPLDDLGAGDVFAAALFVALAGGSDPEPAVALATAAAAVRLQGAGPGAIGDMAAIEAHLRTSAPGRR